MLLIEHAKEHVTEVTGFEFAEPEEGEVSGFSVSFARCPASLARRSTRASAASANSAGHRLVQASVVLRRRQCFGVRRRGVSTLDAPHRCRRTRSSRSLISPAGTGRGSGGRLAARGAARCSRSTRACAVPSRVPARSGSWSTPPSTTTSRSSSGAPVPATSSSPSSVASGATRTLLHAALRDARIRHGRVVRGPRLRVRGVHVLRARDPGGARGHRALGSFWLPPARWRCAVPPNFRTPPGWDSVFTGVLNQPQAPALSALSARVETDWYPFDTEFRYVLEVGDVLSGSGRTPVGQVFMVPRVGLELRAADEDEAGGFRSAQEQFLGEKLERRSTNAMGLEYDTAYREASRDRPGLGAAATGLAAGARSRRGAGAGVGVAPASLGRSASAMDEGSRHRQAGNAAGPIQRISETVTWQTSVARSSATARTSAAACATSRCAPRCAPAPSRPSPASRPGRRTPPSCSSPPSSASTGPPPRASSTRTRRPTASPA